MRPSLFITRWLGRLHLGPPPENSTTARGARAERAAARHLRRRGYRILQQNLRFRYGEIDLLAMHRGTLVVVEVRSYRQGNLPPRATITGDKLRRLRRLADQVHKPAAYRLLPVRIDLVEVEMDASGRVLSFDILEAL